MNDKDITVTASNEPLPELRDEAENKVDISGDPEKVMLIMVYIFAGAFMYAAFTQVSCWTKCLM